jgi:hypothetical protein
MHFLKSHLSLDKISLLQIIFPKLMEILKGRRFTSNETVVDALDTWFADQEQEFVGPECIELTSDLVK